MPNRAAFQAKNEQPLRRGDCLRQYASRLARKRRGILADEQIKGYYDYIADNLKLCPVIQPRMVLHAMREYCFLGVE